MTTGFESGIQEAAVDASQVGSQPTLPAPGADEQKPNDAPASDADAQNPEETAEQAAKKEESRRSRSNARKAQALADARAEAKLYKEQLERALAQQTTQQPNAEPKREDFEDFESFQKAVARHEARQETREILKTEREAQQGKERQSQATAGQQKVAQQWNEREKAFQAANPDYEEVATAFTEKGGEIEVLSTQARLALIESEVGPALLHYLAKNPEAVDRLADLSPASQIRELGKLETKVTMPAKRQTNAPPPPNITKGGSTSQKDPAKMSQPEYEAWRKSQGARWA